MGYTKRVLAALMTLCLTAGLTACSRRQPQPLPTPEAVPAQAETLLPTTAPTTAPTTQPETEPETEPVTEPQTEHFALTFVGDCTFGCNPANLYADVGFVKTVGEDYDYPFRNVLEYFENDDGTFANLEGPLTDGGYAATKSFVFKGTTEYVNILTRGSVEVVSLANNHTYDYGLPGYESTVATLQEAGIPFVEQDAGTVVALESGLTVGLYGGMFCTVDMDDLTQEVAAMRQQGAEVIIFAPHWGVEASYRPTTDQIRIAHEAIDAGVDIVWGAHPHRLQPVEVYNDGIIYYSTGNFSFGGHCGPSDLDTAIFQQEILRHPDGSIELGELTLIPCSISSVTNYNNYQPTPYPEGSQEYLRAMSKLDGTFGR